MTRSSPSVRSSRSSRGRGSGSHLGARPASRREPGRGVRPGDELKVKILEVDDSRRRLSLSVKRVEGQELPTREVSDDVVIEEAPHPRPNWPPARGRGAARAPEAEAPSRRRKRRPNRPPRSFPEAPWRRSCPTRRRPRDQPKNRRRRSPRRGSAVHAGLTRTIGLTGGLGGEIETLAANKVGGGDALDGSSHARATRR